MSEKDVKMSRSLVIASRIAIAVAKNREMFTVKGYCAMFRLFEEEVEEGELVAFLVKKRAQLESLELMISFSREVRQPATELCYDVYDKATGVWRDDLSRAFKIDVERVYDWLDRRM